MDYKQKYREETNKEPYKNVEHKHNFTLDYVKWLEKQLALCNVVGEANSCALLVIGVMAITHLKVIMFLILQTLDSAITYNVLYIPEGGGLNNTNFKFRNTDEKST